MLKSGGIKKSLLRAKQIADQNLGRAEKTEVFTEDIQTIEKRVDVLKNVLQSLVKKVSSSLHAHNVNDFEKRLKKIPSATLATSLLENSQTLGDGVLGEACHACADGIYEIAKAQSTYEQIVETNTLEYFQQLLDNDIPSIKRTKQTLKQLGIDRDAAKSKQVAASKQNNDHPTQANQIKSDSLSSSLEDAEIKVEACKKQYVQEMVEFISKETDITSSLIEWMEAQKNYHKACMDFVSDMLPELRNVVEQNLVKPIFGSPLKEHLESSGRQIAFVIEVCVSILYHEGLEEEGLFRIAASSSKLKHLKAAFNSGRPVDMREYMMDVHVVAGALKQYIRELPEPLLTFELFEEFISSITIKDRDDRLKQLWVVVNKLPESNLANVRYLIKFLAKLAEKSDVNKMTPGNIAIVFGPNLLWSQNGADGTKVALSAVQNHIVETLVTHHEYFFPGDVDIAIVDSADIILAPRASDSGLLPENDRSRLTNSLMASSEYISATTTAAYDDRALDRGLSSSSNDLDSSFNSNGQITNSTDTLEQASSSSLKLEDRKRDKGLRLSFPSAINSAGDKLLGKLRSSSMSKLRSGQSLEKKEKVKVRNRWSLKKSISQEKIKDVAIKSESFEDETSDNDKDNEQDESSDGSKVVFKPRYTPLSEKQMDPWYSGAPDAPLADPEGDSPLFSEPPSRSFPLSHTPSCFHGDYDTAFALASLKGDGLSYLSQVNSVVDVAKRSLCNPDNSAGNKAADIKCLKTTKYKNHLHHQKVSINSNSKEVNDAVRGNTEAAAASSRPTDSLQQSTTNSSSHCDPSDLSSSSPSFCSSQASESDNVDFVEVKGTYPQSNSVSTFKPTDDRNSHQSSSSDILVSIHEDDPPQPDQFETKHNKLSQSVSLNVPSAAFSHNESSSDSSISVQSPSASRKSKKLAPAPPNIPPARPNNTPAKTDSVTNCEPQKSSSTLPDLSPIHEPLKKPQVPPPTQPKVHRPANPPPPCPAPPLPKSENVSSLEGASGTAQITAPYASSDLMSQEESSRVSPTESGLSGAMNSVQLTQNADNTIKGHTRAKSHDLRHRTPPPIPQRTHSVLGKRPVKSATTSPSTENVREDRTTPLKLDTSSTPSILTDESDADQRERMNSVTDDTPL